MKFLSWLLFLLFSTPLLAFNDSNFNKNHIKNLRDQTKELFLHGWNGYINHGLPFDEVKPISCQSYGPNIYDKQDLRNDVLGNFSITLLDSLDTFIIMNDKESFHDGVHYIIENINFDLDSLVQVFETSIRPLGSLLSLHLFLIDEKKGFKMENYNNELLILAYDLGYRLLPAYSTSSGIPLARINLKHGIDTKFIPNNLNYETCTAGAGSPILEMSLLSKLTGDPIFEQVSKNAFMTLWESRSFMDLIPMTLNPSKGKWLDSITGIGASIDSFFEYALKGSILFNDEELFNVWQTAYKSLLTNSKKDDWIFSNINVDNGFIATHWIDSLSAFFPGLQVLAGDIDNAIKSHLIFYKLWITFGGIPERWNFLVDSNFKSPKIDNIIPLEWYPLRPEFIESTYHLYRATKDPIYLKIGEEILQQFEKRFKTNCGFAGWQNIKIGERQDRMESFVLSETLKYLYLLFDEDNWLHYEDSNIIFSTEGHLFWLDDSLIIPYSVDIDDGTENPSLKNVTSHTFKGTVDYRIFHKLKNFINDKVFKLLKKYSFSTRQRTLEHNTLILENKLNRIEMSNINEFGLFTQDLDLIEPICQNKNSKSWIFSNLLNWNKFYEIDYKYEKSLVSPQWLIAEIPLENNRNFELVNKFYEVFSVKDSKCLRPSNTERFELFFGKKEILRLSQVDILKPSKNYNYVTNKEISINDYWIPKLDGINLKLETLIPGKIDSLNNYLTDDYLLNIRNNSINLVFNNKDYCDIPKVLKIIKINGVSIINEKIWIDEINVELLKSTKFSISKGKNNMVLLNDDPIINMFIWSNEI